MKRFKLIVFTDPIAGGEEAYDRWYDTVHLADVLAVPGVVGAQRFKLDQTIVGALPNINLAIYDIEADDPQVVVAEIYKRAGTPAMVISEAIDQDRQNVGLFRLHSDCTAVTL